MLGNLKKWLLPGTDNTASTFNLPESYKNVRDTPAPQQSVLHARGKGYTREQLSAMGGLVQSHLGDVDLLGPNPHAKSFPITLDDDYALTKAEFLLHGTTSDWDSIYGTHGLHPTGTNPSVSDHVKSSATNKTAYVSGSRELTVAKSFAKSSGWIYLFYVVEGVCVKYNPVFRQAEVMAVGGVQPCEILLMRNLSENNIVYQNLDFKGCVVNSQVLDTGFRLIGGGNYPQGSVYWTAA